jgi:hypothetical protein
MVKIGTLIKQSHQSKLKLHNSRHFILVGSLLLYWTEEPASVSETAPSGMLNLVNAHIGQQLSHPPTWLGISVDVSKFAFDVTVHDLLPGYTKSYSIMGAGLEYATQWQTALTAATRAPAAPPLQGILRKQSSILELWETRWVCLVEHLFIYWKTQSQATHHTPLGVIDMTGTGSGHVVFIHNFYPPTCLFIYGVIFISSDLFSGSYSAGYIYF